ncbi:Cytochrome P450 family protein [Quillaja saponaria]|uniref:Cytochrome P450 family protein n=1 Tax=Quillaja saponaria TaxID=32244 RepID=A0AAD7PZU7_QUISA|nr:Cytochrome P450 family protein [Quillaja saponaria]
MLPDYLNILFSVILLLLTLFISTLFFKSFRKQSTKFRPPPSPPSLPIIGHLHLLTGSVMPKSFQTLAALYGPLIQLHLGASTCVVVSNAQVAKEVLKTHELNFSNRPQFGSSNYFLYKGSYFITAPYGPHWRFMRKICMTKLLSTSQLNKFTHVREQEITKLLEFLIMCGNEGKDSDLSMELTTLTNNILCRMAMSSSRMGHAANDAKEIHHLIKEFFDVGAKLSVGEILGPLGKFDLFGYGKKLTKIVGNFDQIVERIMKELEEKMDVLNDHKDCEIEGGDMMDILLQVYKDANAEVRLTRNDIKAFFLDIFLAGTDTIAVALQWAMVEIINHPKVFNEIRAEIDSVVGLCKLVKESDVQNLTYLQAVVKEVLRLHPTAPFVLRQSAEDCKINGYDIKGEARTLVNVYAIMRDPESWVKPEEFIPERFLINPDGINGQENLMENKGQDFMYLPFGNGRRGCPGASLALSVLHVTIGALIQCFDWKVKDGDKVDINEGFSAGLAKPLVCYPVIHCNPFK